jgi:hypothetical protein
MFSRYGMSGMFGPPQGGMGGFGRMSSPFGARAMPPRQMPPTGGPDYFRSMQPRMMDTRGMLPPTDTFNAPPPTMSAPQFPGGMASYMNRLIGGFDPSKFR